MKVTTVFFISLFFSTLALAQDQPSVEDIVSKMQTDLDLQQDQVTNVTPVIQKYVLAFEDLQKSIDSGSMNPSAVESQMQGLEDQETQDLSPYLKPYQLTRWRSLQAELYGNKGEDGGSDDLYSNLPNNPSEE